MKRSTETYQNFYTAREKLLSSLSVDNVGSQKCQPGWRWGPGTRDHYLIHHVLEGKGRFEFLGKTYHLKKGDTFLIYPGMEAGYQADEEDPWEYTWVGFVGTDARYLLNHTAFSVASPVLEQADISGQIEEKIRQIYEAKGEKFFQSVAMTGALYGMFAMLMENSSAWLDRGDHTSRHVKNAVRYIEEHYAEPITVEDIAGCAGVCRSHLYRMFRQVFSRSPRDYLEEYRISQACRLLDETELTVSDVAHLAGYEDSLYFSKAFKKCRGCSPTQYRRREEGRPAAIR